MKATNSLHNPKMTDSSSRAHLECLLQNAALQVSGVAGLPQLAVALCDAGPTRGNNAGDNRSNEKPTPRCRQVPRRAGEWERTALSSHWSESGQQHENRNGRMDLSKRLGEMRICRPRNHVAWIFLKPESCRSYFMPNCRAIEHHVPG